MSLTPRAQAGESPSPACQASPERIEAARLSEQQRSSAGPVIRLSTLALVVDRTKVRRALRTHQADQLTYAELVTLAELLVGLVIAHEAGLTDSTEMAVSDDLRASSLLTVAEAAAVAGVTRAALYRAVSEGRLTAAKAKPYLIAPADLAAYLRRAA